MSTAPAGAVQASIADLAQRMLFQLGDGSWKSRRVLSDDAMNEMHSPSIATVLSAAFRKGRQLRYFPAYGLGWQVFDYRGHPMLWHSGNGDGQLAYLAILPDLQLGVVVLINSWKAGPVLNGGIAARVIDHYLGAPAHDYSAEWRLQWAERMKRSEESERAQDAARLPDAPPSLPLKEYAGTFRGPLGLDVKVWAVADTLRLQYGGGEVASLLPWHREMYRVRWSNPLHTELLPTFVTFGLDASGAIDRLRMDPYGDEIEARRTSP